MATPRRRRRRPRLASAALLAIATLVACRDREPVAPQDPIQQAVDATPANKVGRYSFTDKIILANRTSLNFSSCRILLEGGIVGELQQLPAGATATVMRSRFHPYIDADAFFKIGHQPGKMACDTPDGPRSVSFAGTDTSVTVVVPDR